MNEANTIDKQNPLTEEGLKTYNSQEELIEAAKKYLLDVYTEKEKSLPDAQVLRSLERSVFLRNNDNLWMDHIDAMSQLRENVAFSGYAQKDPLVEYKSLAYEMFMEMLGMIRSNTINTLFKIDFSKIAPAQITVKPVIQKMWTNEAEVEAAISGNITSSTFENSSDNDNPVIVRIKTNANPNSSPNTTGNSHIQQQTSTYRNVGRNGPCPCGSGKKFKKCHGAN